MFVQVTFWSPSLLMRALTDRAGAARSCQPVLLLPADISNLPNGGKHYGTTSAFVKFHVHEKKTSEGKETKRSGLHRLAGMI